MGHGKSAVNVSIKIIFFKAFEFVLLLVKNSIQCSFVLKIVNMYISGVTNHIIKVHFSTVAVNYDILKFSNYTYLTKIKVYR
jgi:hypothetical protein